MIAIALAACLALCGCVGNGIERDDGSNKLNTDGRFLCDKGNYKFETVVDTHTGVTYLVWKSFPADSDTRVGGIAVLLDRDGKPVISEEVSE